jgi:hypothetical protein
MANTKMNTTQMRTALELGSKVSVMPLTEVRQLVSLQRWTLGMIVLFFVAFTAWASGSIVAQNRAVTEEDRNSKRITSLAQALVLDAKGKAEIMDRLSIIEKKLGIK